MQLAIKIGKHNYQFKDIKEVLAKANEAKSGDTLAGVAAADDQERIAAKAVLANLTLGDLRNHPVVPYEEDDVTRLNQDTLNQKIFATLQNTTVGDFRNWLLSYAADTMAINQVRAGLTAEMIAAVAKLMSNLDLIYATQKMPVSATCRTTIGLPGVLANRLQPNHPTDDVEGIIAATFEGLSYGCGDALIGINPCNGTVGSTFRVLERLHEEVERWQIPTQICLLSHITTQMEAIAKGAPADLLFQSIAGSQKGNEAFGFSLDTLKEGQALMQQQGLSGGPNVMYFETGQGSELSSGAHYGADQVTMEARCYALARHFNPYVVNTVVGFIGPEYLYDGAQVIRAGLEDHFMGKLSGLSMGCDCCYTNHMRASQNDIENLALLLASAGCNYFIGAAATDDVMLNYQSTGFHDAAAVREVLGLRPMREFELWLEKIGVMQNGKLTELAGDASIFLQNRGY